jgi:acetyl esterase/lipase
MGMKRMMLLWLCWMIGAVSGFGAEEGYTWFRDVGYLSAGMEADAYRTERCKLDVYRPDGMKGFATVVWFHGGGLTGGEKHVPEGLKGQGLAVVAVNYRLYPKAKCPAYVEDAAAAVVWVLKHIEEYGGDAKQVYVSGHSAGGYLTSMVGLDTRWMKAYGSSPDALAGLIPLSGHTITHFTVREERGIPGTQAVVDDMAPLFHCRADAPPLLLITGDRELEMLGRYEENAYFYRMLKVNGHTNVVLHELQGYGHGMVEPALPVAVRWIRAAGAAPSAER